MPTSEADDQFLASLLEELIEQARGGTPPDLQTLIAQHPEFAQELRELWTTAMIAEDFATLPGERDEIDISAPTIIGERPMSIDPLGIPDRVGDYKPLEEIGRGGMGIVYRAHQISLDRTVALKMILNGQLASPVDVARFRAEAESAARLHHPHIVPVYEVGEFRGQPYFSMQAIEGTTLARQLAEGALPPREAAQLLIPVCEAIADAHRHGVLHRDLKPSNILIDKADRPYVSDFGLAKRVTTSPADDDSPHRGANLTLSGAILGTPGYMAPEQAAGRHGAIGPATDIYGLGAILYAMLTGRPPFQAASPVETVLMVLEQDPVLPRLLNPQADPDLEMIALKCLQKPPELRYASASTLANDLQAYLANEPIAARSSQFSQIISRAFRETHHAAVLENWGLLWILHSLVLLVLCLVTNAMQFGGVTSRLPYMFCWIIGLGLWAAVFWNLRRRSGPITFVERQIAHVWAGSMTASTLLFAVEDLLGLRVLELSPVLGLISGCVFLAKAGILTGKFYFQSSLLFATAVAMAFVAQSDWPDFSISMFGIVSAACFLIPGLKYYRQRQRASRRSRS